MIPTDCSTWRRRLIRARGRRGEMSRLQGCASKASFVLWAIALERLAPVLGDRLGRSISAATASRIRSISSSLDSDVRVRGHRRDPELVGEPPHRDRLDPLRVGDPHRGGDDFVAAAGALLAGGIGRADVHRPYSVQRRRSVRRTERLLAGRAMPQAITVRDLRKSFGDFEAVKGVSFAVGTGEASASSVPTGPARRPPSTCCAR